MQLWKKPSLFQNNIRPDFIDWLLDKGSLTQKLITQSQGQFHVEVLQQNIQAVPFHERSLLNIGNRRWAVIREVLLYGKNQPWVYARTLIPLPTLNSRLRHLHYLGNKPLGDMLFKDPTMQRGPVEIACLPASYLPRPLLVEEDQAVWGRRSVFTLSNKPLLVSEIFLPALLENH